jgi:amidohydrolase
VKIKGKIEKMGQELREWRRHLHAHPETAFEEYGTSDFVAERLASFGIEVQRGLGKTGVVGTLSRGGDSKDAIGLRADIDALDIEEENTFDYKSQNKGKMHACGHDGHTVMLLGAAKYLSENETFRGTVHFIFQPAEENEGGGGKMVEDGLFEKFPVRSVFGMHNFPVLPVGYFAIRSGPVMAAFDVFTITVKGVGAHGARPMDAKDAILASAHLITMFQTVVSRNINPLDSAVISVTEVHGGTTWNVIPETVTMRGTTRSFQEQVQDMIESRMREIAQGVASSMGVSVDLDYERRYPATVNSAQETEEAIRAASMVVSEDRVLTDIQPVMGSEDFAFMLKERPGAYIAIGGGDPRPNGMPHQPGYDFNDEILPIGVSYWVNLIEMLLPKASPKS